MPIIRWNPWSPSSIFEDNFDFPTIPGISRLAGQGLNLYETEEAIVIEAVVAGVPEDKIDVSVENGIVRITGSSQETAEGKTGRQYYMSSLASNYNYSLRLPDQALEKKEPEAELENGILRLTFKKTKKEPPKKIKISSKTVGKS